MPTPTPSCGWTTTTICGSDLHILKGDIPEVTDGRILGHEAVGTVSSGGSRRSRPWRPGTGCWCRASSSAGSCRFCREGRYGQCLGGGGWILGHLIDGTQAEYVRVPFADTSTYPVPDGRRDEEILMLADILPTAYEVGVLNGHVQPGDTVAVVGAGTDRPVRHHRCASCSPRAGSSPSTWPTPGSRRPSGSGPTSRSTTSGRTRWPSSGGSPTGSAPTWPSRRSGVPATFELCTELVRPGGHVANIGVHGKPATLHLETLWTRDVTITTGLVDTYSTPTLLRLLATGQLDAGRFATHHFELDQMIEAYDVFGRAAETGAVKVVLTR